MGSLETKSGKREKPDSIIEREAKIGIVNSLGQILALRRSRNVAHRRGGLDWPGGGFKLGETDPESVVGREAGEEVKGIKLRNIRLLYVKYKPTENGLKESYMFAGNADFPETGIETSSEHEDEVYWPNATDYPNLDGFTPKFKEAVALNYDVIEELSWLAGVTGEAGRLVEAA